VLSRTIVHDCRISTNKELYIVADGESTDRLRVWPSCGFVWHGLMAFVNGLSDYTNAVWMGPAVLAALVAVIVTALMRQRFRRSWLWVHRLNYVIFPAIVVHGLLLGYDLDKETALKVCFAVYMAVVVAGLIYRIVTQLSKARGKG
jgi:hypothetical protein